MVKHKALSNAHVFLVNWYTCMRQGETLKPRGLEIKELEDYKFSIYPEYPFMTFEDRKYNIEYFKNEMLWKLGADRFDDSIKQHAKMWASVQNEDGSFNSNYGQYWFGEQKGFWSVVNELISDPDSRRAVIPMLNASHMDNNVKDKVCTFGVGFRIRNNELNMSVQMRSSDQIFGLGTDLPTFSFLMRMVHAALRNTYHNLTFGRLSVTAMSSHIYSNHYEMVEKILVKDMQGYQIVEMPYVSGMAEVLFLISTKGKYAYAPKEFELANWLISK